MKQITIFILFIVTSIIGCVNKPEKQFTLFDGTYFLCKKNSNDTLFFQKEEPTRINRRFVDEWQIKRDSIYQKDSRGLAYYLGSDKCAYQLYSDTLIVSYKLKNSTNKNRTGPIVQRRFLVLQSNEEFLNLLDLNKNKIVDSTHQIRSDIQLR